ncbi:metal-dependent hydrolase [Halobellus sp. GM3]|uniref:metal-dependent hydrolase n=1 Tax=Halobellus sp. GM3 TaxID=3458410 RepID=UPI00403E1068
MFVGHEFLAFALAGWGARRAGCSDRLSLRLGAVAALAALLPDLDVAYAAATYAVAVGNGAPLGWEAFWGVANGVHRVVTHPLPVGAVAALAFGAAAAVSHRRPDAPNASAGSGLLPVLSVLPFLAALLALGSAAVLLSAFRAAVSPSAAVVAAAFLACVGVGGALVGRRTGIRASALSAAAAVGFLTHPFGDVFLAAPPPLLSPFGLPILTERVSLAADPTLDLLGILLVEVSIVWAGIAVFARLSAGQQGRDRRLRDTIDRRTALGVVYAPAALVLPRPTIADAHVLGFTIVPLALVVAVWVTYSNVAYSTVRPVVSERPDGTPRTGVRPVGVAYLGVLTGLATLTVAAVGYGIVYLLL